MLCSRFCILVATNLFKMTRLTIFSALLFTCFVDKDYTGTYANAFGSEIELRQDGTFKYTWDFDLMGSWTTGTWKVSSDTLRLHIVPVYDTLAKYNSEKIFIKDTLVLSANEKSDRIQEMEYISTLLSSGGQNRQLPDTLFFIKKDKLIAVKNGRLQTKKVKSLNTEKYRPWYVKK